MMPLDPVTYIYNTPRPPTLFVQRADVVVPPLQSFVPGAKSSEAEGDVPSWWKGLEEVFYVS